MTAPTAAKTPLTLSTVEDAWTRRAIVAAVQEARRVALSGSIQSRTAVGSLTEVQWTWIASAAVSAWICARAEQAVVNGWDDDVILRTGLELEPYDAGLVTAILPRLAQSRVDWLKSLMQLTREEMLTFLGDVVRLLNQAAQARARGRPLVSVRTPDGRSGDISDVAGP
jgi:hypothetical protein